MFSNFFTESGCTNVNDAMNDIDANYYLKANSSCRNPLIKNKTFRFVNNIVDNWIFYCDIVDPRIIEEYHTLKGIVPANEECIF